MHSSEMLGDVISPARTLFVEMSWLWVDFFFVLSGFVLSNAYLHQFFDGVSKRSLRAYMVSRFARVYPLHALSTLGAAMAIGAILSRADGIMPYMQMVFNLKALPANLLLVHALHIYGTPTLNAPSWSLSAEWWVYLVFPWLVKPVARVQRSGIAIGCLSVAFFYGAIMYLVVPYLHVGPLTTPGVRSAPSINTMVDFGLLRCFVGFLLGVLLHRIFVLGLGQRWLGSTLPFVAAGGLTLATMHFGAHELLIVACFPWLVLAAAYNKGSVKRALDMPVLQRLGDWSFSIYLLHMPIIYTLTAVISLQRSPQMYATYENFVASKASGKLMCILVLALTLLLSALSHRFLEGPARKWLTRTWGRSS
jgi:peptidoglycan/LPS O-acetylase OafA/YrhL